MNRMNETEGDREINGQQKFLNEKRFHCIQLSSLIRFGVHKMRRKENKLHLIYIIVNALQFQHTSSSGRERRVQWNSIAFDRSDFPFATRSFSFISYCFDFFFQQNLQKIVGFSCPSLVYFILCDLTISSARSSSRICSSANAISQFRNWFSSLIRSYSFWRFSCSFDSFSNCNRNESVVDVTWRKCNFINWIKLTACQTSGEFDCVPGCGLSEGGADDNAESLSEPDKS